jgi:hypothetical protein
MADDAGLGVVSSLTNAWYILLDIVCREGELFDDTTSSEQEKTTDWANASEEAEKAAETKESTTEETK